MLGPGPAPGARIVVESRQLAAIARSFGVAWRPEQPGERAVLDRPGRPLARAEATAALSAALVSAGAPADAEIEIAAFDPPMVPAEGPITPEVTQLDYDAASGRFTARLAIDGTDPAGFRVAGEAEPIVAVVVAARRLVPGAVLGDADLRLARLPAPRVPADATRHLADAAGKQVRFQVAAGAPLPATDLETPVLVRREARVLMLADSPGLALTAEGRAIENGAVGEHVRVVNPTSRAVIDAVVIGENRVRVDPTAPPLAQSDKASGGGRGIER